MADVSRSVYLSRKLSSVNEESSKHVYDGIFSAPAATKHNASSFAARIDDYREIFPPSNASLGSTIPILDLPAVDRSVGPGRGVSSGFDYAGVFGGFGDNDGIEVATEKLFSDSKKSANRNAQPPRIPAPTRRMPSKSQEFSFSNGNDQTSSPGKTRRMPSKSQEFSCNYGNDQTSSPAQARRVPSKSQEFSSNYGNEQRSSSAQMRRMPLPSQEVSSNYVNDQTSSPGKPSRISSKSPESSGNHGNDQRSSPVQTRRIPSKSQEFPCNYGNDQTSIPAQTRRVPSKSQEFSCNYENDEASIPTQSKRMPSKSQEFLCHNGNDLLSRPSRSRKQFSQSQEFSSNISTNQMSTSPVQTSWSFLRSEGDTLSGTSPNDPTSASALPHETVDSMKHVSVSYNKPNQFNKDGPNGMTHIAHLHAVPGYTLLFDEAGPVRKPSLDKAKRLSMDDADFSGAVGKVSRQGKHLRAVSDLGTNQLTSDHDKQEVNFKPQTRSMSMSNSPQSFGSSGYFKRSSRRRTNRSTKNQENIAYADPFLLLEEELDVNSPAAVSAAAMKRAIEEAEVKMRWAKNFLKDLEGNGFIKPTLKDSFKVKVKGDVDHSSKTYGLKQNGSLKVKLTRQKKFYDEGKVLRQNSYLNSEASVGSSHANEAGAVKPTVGLDLSSQKQHQNEATGLKQALHVLAAGVDTNVRSPAPENFEETNAHDDLKFAEKSCKVEGGGEWEAAKQISQLFTGVKNRFVSFMSKQADTEKTVIQKDAPSKSESLEQSSERPHEVRNVNSNQKREADLDHTVEIMPNGNNNQEKEADMDGTVEMNRSTCFVTGKSTQDSIGTSIDVEICEAKDHERSTSGSTSSPDTEVLTTKQCRLSEPEEVLEYREVQASANKTNDVNQDISIEVKAELLQEDREQNQEMLQEKVKIREENQMGNAGPEERHESQEKACQSQAYDDKVKNSKDNEEPVDVMPSVESDESLNNEAVISRQIYGFNLTESVRMVEEIGNVERCYEGRVGAEETYGGKEDTEIITGQDVTSVAAECLTEVVDDVSKHDENLSATDELSEQDELFWSRNQEACVPDNINQYVQGVEFLSDEKGRMTESAAVLFEPEENVEPPQSVQRVSELIGGVYEQTPCSIDVVGDDSEHDEYLPAVDDILDEQDEFLSSSRNEEASVNDIVSQYALDVPSQKGRLTEATSATVEVEGNTERPRSVQIANQLNEECISDDSVSHSEAADKSLEHGDYLPTADDVCEKDKYSCLNTNAETGGPDKNQNSQEEKVSAEKERMTTGGQMEDDLIGEMTETSMSAGGRLDLDDTEKETKEPDDVNPSIDVEITERDSVLKYEQRLYDEESATDMGPENQDESEVNTREANNVANDQDASLHTSELSHKRRRWFVNREEVKFQQSGIFQGNESTLETDQENAESLAVKDRVESCVDENVNNIGEQADGDSDQDQKSEGLQSTESSHRRRRWFENRGENVQHNPCTVDGVGVTADMDHEIAQEFKHDPSSHTIFDRVVNERKDGVELMESSNLTSDKAECRASTEAGHRRRRWFENGQKSEEEEEEETKVGADTTKQELHETSSSEESANAQQSEEQSKAREKEKERQAVERAIREARKRAFDETKVRANAEARLKAAASIQDRTGKTTYEAKPPSDKASMDAKLRAERAAVERATAEARERALQKSISEKVIYKSREKVDFKNLNSGPSSSGHSTSVPFTSERPSGATTESPQRRKAITERNKRTTERAAKALEEKNMRDVLVQKEQAERNRFAGVLDAEVKRWSTGKEGNLRSLLSTLQYVLGPDSGWQPIPLTDLVTPTAVRKAYKRAALCVHPDKLQQRRATIQQKYICEKVFDLLKDAWHKFNPDDR
ncbi:hypothetical protein V2J09_007201 [Rumex salicifolius]